MAYEAQKQELLETKAELQAAILHAMARVTKVRDEFVGANDANVQPAIDALNEQINSYRTLLN